MRPGSPARRRLTPALLVMAMVAALLPLGQAATAATNTAIQLNGTTQYATLGTNAQLRSAQFTVELWFKRTGTGTVIGGTGTGTGGLPTTVIPLIAKGRAEAETRGRRHQLLLRDRQRHEQARCRLRGSTEHGWWHAGGTQPPDSRQLSGYFERLASRRCHIRRRRVEPLLGWCERWHPYRQSSGELSHLGDHLHRDLTQHQHHAHPDRLLPGSDRRGANLEQRPHASTDRQQHEPGGRIPDDGTARPLGRERRYRYGIRRRVRATRSLARASPRRRGWRARLRSTRPHPVRTHR